MLLLSSSVKTEQSMIEELRSKQRDLGVLNSIVNMFTAIIQIFNVREIQELYNFLPQSKPC